MGQTITIEGMRTILLMLIIAAAASVAEAASPTFLNVSFNQTFIAPEDSQFFMYVLAEDADGQYPLNFTDTAGSVEVGFDAFSMSNFNATTALINFTPGNLDVGLYSFFILAEDSVGEVGVVKVNFNVTNTNDAPNITSFSPTNLTDQTAKEASTITFNITADDLDLVHGDILNYTWLIDGKANASLLSFAYNGTFSTGNYTPDFQSSNETLRNVTAIVYDLDNASSQISWLINVTNVNRPILLNATIPDSTWVEDTNLLNVLNLDDYFFDNDTDDYPLQYSVTGNSEVTVIITEYGIRNHTVSYYPAPDFEGIEVITFIADDGFNATQSNSVTLNVTNVNDPPVVNTTDKLIYIDVPFQYDIPVADPDGPTLLCDDNTTLFAVFPVGGNTCRISFTPTVGDIANYTILITANDSFNASTDSFLLEIRNNSKPVLGTPVNDIYTTELNLTIVLFNATDIDPGDTMVFYSSSSPNPGTAGLFDIDTTDPGPTTATASLSFTPQEADVGNYSLTIYVNDSRGAVDSVTISVFILGIEHPPVLDPIPIQKIKINTSFSLNITATDIDLQELTFSTNDTDLTVTPFNLTNFPISGTDDRARIDLYPIIGDLGLHYILINVTDTVGKSDSQIVIFNVTENEAPVIPPIPDQVAQEDQLFTLQVNATDPNPQDEPLSLYTNNHTELFTITSTGLISFTPTQAQVGNYTINLTVSDGELNDSIAFNLTVNFTNDFPIFVPPLNEYYAGNNTNDTVWNSTIFEKFTTTIYVNATDEESAVLDFNAAFVNFTNVSGDTVTTNISLFTMVDFDGDTGLIDFTPTNDQVGLYYVNISVSDGANINWSVIAINVFNTNDNPSITLREPNGTLFAIAENETIILNVTATDVDYLDEVNYSWFVDGSNQGVFDPSFNYTPGFLSEGVRNITVVVGDLNNGTNQTGWTAIVSNTNRRPWFGQVITDTYTEFSAGIWVDVEVSGNDRTGGRVTLSFNGTHYTSAGNYTSAIYEMDPNLRFNLLSLEWDAEVNITQALRFYTKTANSTSIINTLNWSGPVTVSGTTIPNGEGRFIQYYVDFLTADTLNSPTLKSTTINYQIANFSVPQNGLYGWVSLEEYFHDLDTDDVLTFNATFIDSVPDIGITIQAAPPYRAFVNATVFPEFIGTEEIFFTMMDRENITVSNVISIIIEETQQETGGGGGGGASPRPIRIPIEIEVPEPVSFSLITPGIVTTYENDTVEVPINLINDGEFTLNGITLSASTANEDVELILDEDGFETLDPGDIAVAMLTIISYKTQPSYEVLVSVNVSDPLYDDHAKILINSLHKGERNETQINTKLAFAEDLLRANAECLELNEFVSRAKDAIGAGQYAEAAALLDATIEGCKYLVAPRTAPVEEEPTVLGFPRETMLIFVGVLMSTIIAVLAITYGRYRTKKVKVK